MCRTLERAACLPTLSVSPLWYVSRYSPCVWFDEPVVALRVASTMGNHQRPPTVRRPCVTRPCCLRVRPLSRETDRLVCVPLSQTKRIASSPFLALVEVHGLLPVETRHSRCHCPDDATAANSTKNQSSSTPRRFIFTSHRFVLSLNTATDTGTLYDHAPHIHTYTDHIAHCPPWGDRHGHTGSMNAMMAQLACTSFMPYCTSWACLLSSSAGRHTRQLLQCQRPASARSVDRLFALELNSY